MSHRVKVVVGVLLAGVVFVGLFVVDQFIYPFTASPPYFSDVEKVFDRIQIPADWKETGSFDNKGIAGKRCPIEPGSACFLKSKIYTVPESTTLELVKEVLMTVGCPVVASVDNTALGSEQKKYRLACSVDGLNVGGDFDFSKDQVYVSITST